MVINVVAVVFNACQKLAIINETSLKSDSQICDDIHIVY